MLPRRARDAKVRLQMQRTLSGRHPCSGNQFGTIDHFGLGENIAQVRFTVESEISSWRAISLLLAPSRTMPTISRSFAVRMAGRSSSSCRQSRMASSTSGSTAWSPLALFAGERHVAHQRDTGDDPPLAADKDLGHVAHVIRQHKFMIVMPVAVAEPRRHRRHGGVLVAKVRRQKRIQRLEVFQILLVRIIGNIMQYIVFGF